MVVVQARARGVAAVAVFVNVMFMIVMEVGTVWPARKHRIVRLTQCVVVEVV